MVTALRRQPPRPSRAASVGQWHANARRALRRGKTRLTASSSYFLRWALRAWSVPEEIEPTVSLEEGQQRAGRSGRPGRSRRTVPGSARWRPATARSNGTQLAQAILRRCGAWRGLSRVTYRPGGPARLSTFAVRQPAPLPRAGDTHRSPRDMPWGSPLRSGGVCVMMFIHKISNEPIW